jgi:hypothetical protein
MKLLLLNLDCISGLSPIGEHIKSQGKAWSLPRWEYIPYKLPSNKINMKDCITIPDNSELNIINAKKNISIKYPNTIGFYIIQNKLNEPYKVCYFNTQQLFDKQPPIDSDITTKRGTYIWTGDLSIYFNKGVYSKRSSNNKFILSGDLNSSLTVFDGTLKITDIINNPSLLVNKLEQNNSNTTCFSLLENISIKDLQNIESEPETLLNPQYLLNKTDLSIKEFKTKLNTLKQGSLIPIGLYIIKPSESGTAIDNIFVLLRFSDEFNINCCKNTSQIDFCGEPYNNIKSPECINIINTYCKSEIKDPFCGCYQPYIQHNLIDANPPLKAYLKGVGLSASCASSCSPPAYMPDNLPACNLSICSADIGGNTSGIKGIYVNQQCGSTSPTDQKNDSPNDQKNDSPTDQKNDSPNNQKNDSPPDQKNDSPNNQKNDSPLNIKNLIILFIIIFILLIFFIVIGVLLLRF